MAIFMESVPVSALSNIASETIPLQSIDESSESSTEDEKSNDEDIVLESTKEDENLDNDTEENDNNTEVYEEVEVVKPKKLWLKYNVSDGIIHDAVKKILSDYNGIDEVYVKDTGTNQAFKMNTLVTVRESLIYELETILEKANIFIQE